MTTPRTLSGDLMRTLINFEVDDALGALQYATRSIEYSVLEASERSADSALEDVNEKSLSAQHRLGHEIRRHLEMAIGAPTRAWNNQSLIVAMGALEQLASELSLNAWGRPFSVSGKDVLARWRQMPLHGDDEAQAGSAEVARNAFGPNVGTVGTRLSGRARQLLNYRFIEGRSVAECAAALGIPAVEARIELQRALRDLRRPNLATDIGWRVVLSWNQVPEDLDLFVRIATEYREELVSFQNIGSMEEFPWTQLQADVRSGRGPEEIRFARVLPGIYSFFVLNFSRDGALRDSEARLELTFGPVELTLKCPQEGEGVWWESVSIDTRDWSMDNLSRITNEGPLRLW